MSWRNLGISSNKIVKHENSADLIYKINSTLFLSKRKWYICGNWVVLSIIVLFLTQEIALEWFYTYLVFFKEIIFLSLIEALRKVALVYRLSKKHQLIMADAFQLILICFKKKMSWVFFKWLTSCFLSNLLGILVVDIIFFKLNWRIPKF